MTAQHSIYEILAKEIAYIFDNPEFNKPVNEFFSNIGYVLDRVFSAPDIEFRAFGLLPSGGERSPILVLRGTNKAIDDIARDCRKAIGLSHFVKYQNELATWLIHAAQITHQKVVVIGHCLGGAIAQIVATELLDWIEEVVTFSSPGTSRDIAAKFIQHGGANLDVTHYIIDGDIISLAGEAFIAGKVIVQCFRDRFLNPLHNIDARQPFWRLLSNPPFGLAQTEISVQTLSHPTFTFFSTDYLEFLAGYYKINPKVALCLTSRGKFEALRRSGFSLPTISC
ncbi:lipase family protein, partial [Aliterella atlantica]|uniref:Uncharacterized protein n=1 Tax=Aliterella atlantica CENA595 TaxID=1618023 RepID=A0A0D8ZRJ8_9CYAN